MPSDQTNTNSNNTGTQRVKTTANKNLSGKMRRSRSGADGHHVRSVELDGEIVLPRRIRARLDDAYNQIEREFELLYAENIALREELKALHDRLDGDKGESSETADGSTPGLKVTAKKSGSQISQRIKTTYKASTSKIVSSFKTPQPASQHVREYRGHRDGVWEVQVSQNQPQIIGTASADHTARLYCIETGTCVLQYTGHSGSVNSVRFHPTQDLVLTSSGDQSSHIWRPQISLQSTIDQLKSQCQPVGDDDSDVTGEREEGCDTTDVDQSHEPLILRQPIVELGGHTAVVIAADWLSGGSHVISASWDRTANLYDSESGVVVNTLTGHDSELTNVYAHTSQRLVVTSSKDATFRLWDLRTPMQVNVFQGHTQTVTSAVFAGVDKVVSGSDDRCVKVWDLKNMQSPIVTIRTDSAVNRLSVSSATQNIAIPHDNRNIRIHDIHGTRLGRLTRSNRQGHTRMVCGAVWCEDNSVCNLFTCGFDRQVIGWNFKE